MDEIRTHTHARGLATEVVAFNKAQKISKALKLRIIEELSICGESGMTPDEFVLAYGGLINTVRRRFTDLWKEGKIRHHPDKLTRKNASGNPCVAWVLGEDPEAVRQPTRAKYTLSAMQNEYIHGFDHGCDYIVAEIERYIKNYSHEPRISGPIESMLERLGLRKQGVQS